MADSASTSIECPWCGETIRKTAILCRFCKNDVTPRGLEAARRFLAGEAPPEPAPAAPPAAAPVPARGREAASAISTAMPASLLDQIVAAGESIDEGERRPITVLFTDLCGFTTLTAQIGAERMNELLDLIYAESREIVSYYGGIIEKFIGDAVMAVFGALRAHGDDPERAIRAALDIREAIRKIGQSEGMNLDAHSGVAFGEVIFTARGGAGGSVDYRSIGDAVNLASRLEGEANDGETLTDHRTYQQTRTVFEWVDLEPLAIRGKAEPVVAHRVVGIRKRFSHARLGERIDMAPLVGRKEELYLLVQAALEAAEGCERVVWIEGESGVGKSRLVYEASQNLDAEAWNWFTGRCLSYGKNTPFFPFLELIRSMLLYSEDSREDVTRQCLENFIDRLYGPAIKKAHGAAPKKAVRAECDAVFAALAYLLSIHIDLNPLMDATPRVRRERIFGATIALVARLTEERPLMLIFEDFQWADEDSRELLLELIAHLSGKPILFVVAARNAPSETLPIREGYVHIPLEELSVSNSVDLLRRLLGIDALPPRLCDRILEKTAGNPFFIEEIVLSLEERGDIQRERGGFRLLQPLEKIEIPDTVESVVLARLDRLERTVRSVLQCASVIGQEFRREILSQVTEVRQRLRDHLFSLVEDDYVLQQTLIPEMVYAFRHVVLRDVAYGTLLDRRRRQFHRQVAEAIETLFPDRLDEYVELLAHHYAMGQVVEKALHYLERAAIKAEALYSNYAAADFWERLLETLDLPKAALDDADHRERRSLRLRACLGQSGVALGLGELCRKIGRPERCVEVHEMARKTAAALKDERGVVMALRGLGEAHRLAGRVEQAAECLTAARRRARQMGEPGLMAESEHVSGHFETMRGNYAKAGKFHEQALEHAREAQQPRLIFQVLNNLGIVDMYRCRLDSAEARFGEALELAHELGRKAMAVQIGMNLGIVLAKQGKCAEARKRYQRAIAEADRLEFELAAQQALAALGDLALRQGEWQRGADLARQLLQRNGGARFSDLRAIALTNEARARVALGELDGVADSLDEAQRLAEADGNYIGLVDARSVRVELLLSQSKKAKAVEEARETLEIVREHDDTEHLAAVRELYARALLAEGRSAEALAMAREALQAARQSGVVRDEAWADWTIGEASRLEGQENNARQHCQKALELALQVGDKALATAVKKSFGALKSKG